MAKAVNNVLLRGLIFQLGGNKPAKVNRSLGAPTVILNQWLEMRKIC